MKFLKRLLTPADWRPVTRIQSVSIVEYEIYRKVYRHRFYDPETKKVTSWYKGRPTWHQIIP